MSSPSTHEFPVPVGGAPFDIDFVPSILFAVLYGLLAPVALYRLSRRRSRTLVLIGTSIMTIEHIVAFYLRANSAHKAGPRESAALQAYLQTSLGGGFITIGQEATALLRALLVSATFVAPSGGREVSPGGSTVALRAMGVQGVTDTSIDPEDDPGAKPAPPPLLSRFALGGWQEDQPRRRLWIRRVFGTAFVLFLIAITLGIVVSVDYKQAIRTGAHASLVQQLRYASAALAYLLLHVVTLAALYGALCIPRVPRGPALLVLVVTSLLTVVALYRLIIMHHSTTSLLSMVPGSQNTSGEKAVFYILHAAPEWLAVALLLSVDARSKFKTGLLGDRNSSKPMPEP
ncbi:hypothetical protein C8Q78DRAFT_1080325 [Trametes maxima]|nr:hypothetical protein C8Q78DRAFT_1080325 [Trametes maxima]